MSILDFFRRKKAPVKVTKVYRRSPDWQKHLPQPLEDNPASSRDRNITQYKMRRPVNLLPNTLKKRLDLMKSRAV